MRPFVNIVQPHEDIISEKPRMDVFAANLWKVHQGDAPAEYQDPDIFFKKTYMTRGLKNIVDIVSERLEGRGGDHVIQLQTPFGGGKTHTLITLYHKAGEMGTKTVILSGDALDASETTLWGEMERQLRGEVREFTGKTAPGMDKIIGLLGDNQPVLILIDELLEYAVKAAGITVGESTLAAQLLPFMQELSQAASSLERVVLIVTLPSSHMERFDESAEKLFNQLTRVLGRTERIFTPVEDDEIYSVIRRRLFKYIDEHAAREVIEKYIEKAESEGTLPDGVDANEYREIFRKSYPFQPEVIDVIYERWGLFPEFQRTRGVLRLLAMVVNSLRSSGKPVIRLSDFPLKGSIRREFLRFIGNNFDSIISSDITSPDSGAKVIDRELKGYEPYKIGTRIATSIFLYSFSGGGSRNGATIRNIKMACLEPEISMSIIDDALNRMIDRLFYIHKDLDLYYFSADANINAMVIRKKENIKDEDLMEEERKLVGAITAKKLFKVYIWPSSTSDVPDDMELKLIVLSDYDRCTEFLENKGEQPRVYRNTMIFLVEDETYEYQLKDHMRTKMAWRAIESDRQLTLTDEQKREVREKIKALGAEDKEKIRDLYRIVMVPSRSGLERIDLGMATYGVDVAVDYEIKSRLIEEDKLLDKIDPLIIERKYLKDDYIETERILNSFYTTPGAMRITGSRVLEDAIRKGVKKGLFGIGVLEDEPHCRHIYDECTVTLKSPEIIVKPEICEKKFRVNGKDKSEFTEDEKIHSISNVNVDGPIISLNHEITQVKLEFEALLDDIYDIVRIKKRIMEDFREVEATVGVRIMAADGKMDEGKYNSILETLEQFVIHLKKESGG